MSNSSPAPLTEAEARKKLKLPVKHEVNPSYDNAVTTYETLYGNSIFEVGPMQHGLPLLLDMPMIAATLKVSLEKYFFTLVDPKAQWQIFEIPKKRKTRTIKLPDGSQKSFTIRNVRTIQAPGALMKYILFKFKKELFDKIPLPEYITGFRPGYSCVKTAEIHAHGATIISFDIMNAYQSTSRTTIREQVLKPLGYSHMIAHHLASQLTIDNILDIPLSRKELAGMKPEQVEACSGAKKVRIRSLPQGSPASPAIFNCVVAATFGPELAEYCKNRNLVLTVYADDITVSTAQGAPALPHEEALQVVKDITQIVRNHKFMINFEKTKIMNKASAKQTVMGITVNDGLHVNNRYLLLRAVIHNIVTNGMIVETKRWLSKQLESVKHQANGDKKAYNKLLKLAGLSNFEKTSNVESLTWDELPVSSFLGWIRGNLNWLNQVDERHGEALKAQFELAYAKFISDKTIELKKNFLGPSYYAGVGVEPSPMDSVLEQLWGAQEIPVKG